MPNPDLRTTVLDNLESAMEGGYDISGWTAEDIVADLLAFAADCEDNTPEELLPHVRAWLDERKRRAVN